MVRGRILIYLSLSAADDLVVVGPLPSRSPRRVTALAPGVWHQ